MIVAIADTHTALWYLFSDPRLGAKASAFIDEAIAAGNYIGISSISVAEMVYLIEKGRISARALDELHKATADPKAVFRHVPLDENISMAMAAIPRQEVPDLPDRIIAATAKFYGVPVLSRDEKIRSSAVPTIR